MLLYLLGNLIEILCKKEQMLRNLPVVVSQYQLTAILLMFGLSIKMLEIKQMLMLMLLLS